MNSNDYFELFWQLQCADQHKKGPEVKEFYRKLFEICYQAFPVNIATKLEAIRPAL